MHPASLYIPSAARHAWCGNRPRWLAKWLVGDTALQACLCQCESMHRNRSPSLCQLISEVSDCLSVKLSLCMASCAHVRRTSRLLPGLACSLCTDWHPLNRHVTRRACNKNKSRINPNSIMSDVNSDTGKHWKGTKPQRRRLISSTLVEIPSSHKSHHFSTNVGIVES